MNDTRKTFAMVAKDAILSVPGAEWGQIIRDLNGPDKDKREAALAYLKNVMHEDPTVEYTATVWFNEFPQDEPMEVILIRTDTPTSNDIDLQSLRRNLVERKTIHGDVVSARTAAQAKAELVQRLCNALNRICGNGTIVETKIDTEGFRTVHWDSLAMPSMWVHKESAWLPSQQQMKDLASLIPKAAGERQIVTQILADCITDAYGKVAPGSQPPTIDIPWQVTDTRQFLTILINQNHFNRVKKNLKIQAVVHKKDDVNVMVNRLSRISIDPNDFEPTPNHGLIDLKIPNEPQKYVWNSINMTDFQGYDAETAQRVEDLRKKLDEWASLQVNQK